MKTAESNNTLERLTDHIRKCVPKLRSIEVGQVFFSSFYGYIQATIINKYSENLYAVYGFDLKEGFPRNNYYPRDLKLVGKKPMLNDVLEWLKGIDCEIHSINKYGMMHDRKWELICQWDLSKDYLKDQKQATIEHLYNLIKNDE